MNRERAKELLPIIQAFAEGNDVEYISTGGRLVVIEERCSFDENGEYRIKPEPEVIYVIDSKHGDGKIVVSDKGSWPEYKVKKFQEVLDD